MTVQPWAEVLFLPRGIHITLSLNFSTELKIPTNEDEVLDETTFISEKVKV